MDKKHSFFLAYFAIDTSRFAICGLAHVENLFLFIRLYNVEPDKCLDFSYCDPWESFLQHREYDHLGVAHRFGTGHDAEGTKFIFEKTEELQVRGFVLKKFVKIYVNKL